MNLLTPAGFYLIGEGLASIVKFKNQKLLWNLGRLGRVILGVFLVVI